jgi:putative transposase
MSFLTKPSSSASLMRGRVGDYNQRRPHSALGYLTPAAYAANLTATCDRLRNPDKLRRSHVAPTPPHGVKSAEALITAG